MLFSGSLWVVFIEATYRSGQLACLALRRILLIQGVIYSKAFFDGGYFKYAHYNYVLAVDRYLVHEIKQQRCVNFVRIDARKNKRK